MAYKYKIKELPATELANSIISDKQKSLVSSIDQNQIFTLPDSFIELGIYSFSNIQLNYIDNYKRYKLLQNAQSAGKAGATILTIDPVKDAIDLGYETGDVRILYTFLDNLYSNEKEKGQFFVNSISADRTEIRGLSLELESNDIKRLTEIAQGILDKPETIEPLILNLGEGKHLTVINIDTQQIDKGLSIILKLNQPLPTEVDTNTKFTVNSIVSSQLLYEVESELEVDEIKIPNLRGPNFSVEAINENNQPTEFLNYNELFSFPVTSSYYELFSLFNEKSAQIAINHDEYSDFIHFSSAEERLRNFKYKLDLIHSYTSSIATIEQSRIAGSGSYTTEITGSKTYFENLISGIVDNFDHYDRFLFFGSGSKSWPKSNSIKPYLNYPSSHTSGSSFFNTQLISASNYDVTNFDLLTNTIPNFIREDRDNIPYQMFIHMIGQHFDNLWIYMKAVSDKYNTDHRLNFGVSKDIVREAIQSFGINLYNSNQNTDNLFSQFVGEAISTGSNSLITTMSIATSASFNSGSTHLQHLQPTSKDNYQKEIYKRIYHNLPHLVKTKGTERGLRALINCFGIPKDILEIKTFGGQGLTDINFYGPEFHTTSSNLDKIRLDNTGSLLSGSTLSRYNSIFKEEKKYTDDQHFIEVGFDLSNAANSYIDTQISGSNFDMDQYIGDPRSRYDTKYEPLTEFGRGILNRDTAWNFITYTWDNYPVNWNENIEFFRTPNAFIRLLNYFDSAIFRIIKDFVPARTKAATGLIVKSHKLARSKIKQVEATPENIIHTGSKSIASITGSQGGSYDESGSFGYTTNYNAHLTTPIGPISRNVTDEAPMYNGEFSGSLLISTDGEVGKLNPFVQSNQPNLVFNITLFNETLPPPPACILILSASFIGEAFEVGIVTGTDTTAQITYPTPSATITESLDYGHNFDDFEFFTIEATDTYPGGTFQGWFTNAAGTGSAVSTSNPLTIYNYTESDLGNKFYAYYS